MSVIDQAELRVIPLNIVIATTNKQRIPVRTESRETFIEEKLRIVEEYEKRYEMTSEEMADLVDRDATIPTIEVIQWYRAYDVLQFFLETAGTPTFGSL